jgi:hypothetical protein
MPFYGMKKNVSTFKHIMKEIRESREAVKHGRTIYGQILNFYINKNVKTAFIYAILNSLQN